MNDNTTTSESISTLVAKLKGRNPVGRTQAREDLVRVGHHATPSLVTMLKSPVQHFRWEAAKTLVGIADPRAAQALLKAMDDRDQDVRWIAAEAMIALGREAVVPLLTALIEQAESVEFCRSAHHVLSGLPPQQAGPVLTPVLRALETQTPALTVPLAAEAALERLRRPSRERPNGEWIEGLER
jgi:HEAT repeat protein